MAPNNYNPNYYAANNPGHPNQPQAYSGYQTQNSNAGQPPSRQYHQGQSVAITQSTDYMPYPAQSYNGQGSYEAQQDDSWAGNFGASCETTSRAAETLRNLSNTAYASGGGITMSSPGFTPANAATSSRYATAVPQPQSSYDSRMSSRSTNALYDQNQARPRSVNSVSSTHTQASALNQGLPPPASTAAYSSQRTQSIFNQQRPASPVQSHYAQNATTHGASKMLMSVSSSAQYNDYSRRAPPNVTEPPRPASATAVSTGYSYGEGNLSATAGQATITNGDSNQYDQSTITVDPMQVYDPWPEYQRKQEALKAAKAAEDAARAEETRKAEEAKRLEEARKAEEQKKLEEGRRVREAQVPVPAAVPEATSKKAKANLTRAKSSEKPTAPEVSTRDPKTGLSSSGNPALEAEIRAMMAKMRELNSKDPALLARIWEQERRNHVASQSPPAQNDPAPRAAAQVVSKNGIKTSADRGAKLGTNQKSLAVNGSDVAQLPSAAHQSKAQTQAPPKSVTQVPAQPAATSVPPVKQQGSTIWPPEKKVQLAAAASSWLNSIPQNKEKQTTGDQIRRMLDSNPSYIDLCEKLERMGLKLERAAFARALLAAVPDVNSASRQSIQTQDQSSARASAERPPLSNAQSNGAVARSTVARSDDMPRKEDPPTQPKPKNENAFHSGESVVNLNPPQPNNVPRLSRYPPPPAPAVQSPYLSTNYPPFPDSTPTGSPTSAPIAQITANSNNQPARPTPKPASKEEAARKRNFSEVVDLTGFSDDDAIPPPQKKHQLDYKFSSAPPVGPVLSSATQSHVPSRKSGTFQYNPVAIPQPLTTHAPPHVPPFNDRIRSSDVVRPIDKRKALRRSTYDIKTIARDVLLATGKHPEMRPLNAHLEILKNSFDKVDGASDLSTFRWDLVDPGEPPKGYLQNNMFEHEVDDADDEEDSGDDEAPAPARPRVTVQQAIGAGGGNQTSIHTSAVLMNGPVKVAPKRRGRPPRNSFPMVSRPSGFGDGEPLNPRTNQAPNRPSEGDRGYSSRPMGSSQNQASPATASGSIPTATSSAPRPSGSGVGYSAFRPTHAPDGTPLPKKKGRPVGWRKHIHGSPEAQARVINRSRPSQPSGLRNVTTPANNPIVVIDSRSPSVVGGPSSGRMRSNKDPERHYSVYKCHWKNCTAELHNLETLRKHVHKIHGKLAAHGGYDCLWANCGKEVTTTDERTGIQVEAHQYFDFPNDAEWREHLELKHFGPLAWTLGDGPASGLSDAHDSEAYLSDSYGRRVTPQISAPISQESSSAVYSAGPSRAMPEPGAVRRGRPPKKSKEQVAQDVETAMVKKKREIGPGVDRGGARLVTEKRRLGFNDDEDFDEEIVDREDD